MLCKVLLVVNGFWFTTCTMVCNQATPQSSMSLPISPVSLSSCIWHWWDSLVVPEPTSHLFLDGSQPALPEVSVQHQELQINLIKTIQTTHHKTIQTYVFKWTGKILTTFEKMAQLMVWVHNIQLFYSILLGSWSHVMAWFGANVNLLWMCSIGSPFHSCTWAC